MSARDLLRKAQKRGFPKRNEKVIFTIHENIFPGPLNPKIFLEVLEHFQYPLK
jgi:hypothetical protein